MIIRVSSYENNTLLLTKKNQASPGLQPMTSVTLSQRYYSRDHRLESYPSLNFLQVLFSQLDLIKFCT